MPPPDGSVVGVVVGSVGGSVDEVDEVEPDVVGVVPLDRPWDEGGLVDDPSTDAARNTTSTMITATPAPAAAHPTQFPRDGVSGGSPSAPAGTRASAASRPAGGVEAGGT